jgi:hypothetical protein
MAGLTQRQLSVEAGFNQRAAKYCKGPTSIPDERRKRWVELSGETGDNVRTVFYATFGLMLMLLIGFLSARSPAEAASSLGTLHSDSDSHARFKAIDFAVAERLEPSKYGFFGTLLLLSSKTLPDMTGVDFN